ncbi:hypothetical protein CDD81_2016 [Ophiocordyceps australis]|uniref:Amino acid transporter transmembrane domain-containing protein n=1 Tax=Ophiocordyceps australis TaxID=1399860 RepID=A0A2C5YFD3_9HYPO|nr:hypothetical protein CDD81_2016 [Ophiocordyceps australis]
MAPLEDDKHASATPHRATDWEAGSKTQEAPQASSSTSISMLDPSSGGSSGLRTLSRRDTILVLITNQVGMGLLSLPKILQTLGIVPGVLALVAVGGITFYTALELLRFWRVHRQCVSVVDMARVVGGPVLEAIVGVGLVVKVAMTCASATVTMTVALNAVSGHGMCTVGFAACAVLACWALCLPRTMKFAAQTGIPSTLCMLAAILVLVVSLGVAGGPRHAPAGPWQRHIVLFGRPSFNEGIGAFLKVCYAYAGNVAFVSYMAEMRDPSRDFAPALAVLQLFSIVLYLASAIAIYWLSAQYTTSPALGSAPLLAAKVAYAIALPALLATGLVFGHAAIKFLYVAVMRAIKATHQLADRSVKSWTAWVVCASFFWLLTFLLASAVPVFDSILSIASATLIAWFAFGISGVFWFHRNWHVKFKGRNAWFALVNALLILQALFMNGVGLWAALRGLIDIFNDKSNKIGGAFTCADNSIF